MMVRMARGGGGLEAAEDSTREEVEDGPNGTGGTWWLVRTAPISRAV
jgi:hypothetical protein